jgi:hypothetical protein
MRSNEPHISEDEVEKLKSLLKQIEQHCPCGARPESLNTHPHVCGCPVELAVIILTKGGDEKCTVTAPRVGQSEDIAQSTEAECRRATEVTNVADLIRYNRAKAAQEQSLLNSQVIGSETIITQLHTLKQSNDQLREENERYNVALHKLEQLLMKFNILCDEAGLVYQAAHLVKEAITPLSPVNTEGQKEHTCQCGHHKEDHAWGEDECAECHPICNRFTSAKQKG